MRIKRKHVEYLHRIADSRLTLELPSGAILDVSFEHLYLMSRYGADQDGRYSIDLSSGPPYLIMKVTAGRTTYQRKEPDAAGS